MNQRNDTTKSKKKQILRSSLRITLLVLAALIVGINMYLLNASRLAGNVVPMPFGVGSAVVLSGSMEPEISVGDLLIVFQRKSYEVGDVVVYQDGKMAVTHRIVSISGNEVITRGEANNTDDAPITLEQIKGEVVFVIPYVGFVVNAIKTPICTICIFALSVFLIDRSYRAERQQKEKELDAIRAEIEKLKQNK